MNPQSESDTSSRTPGHAELITDQFIQIMNRTGPWMKLSAIAGLVLLGTIAIAGGLELLMRLRSDATRGQSIAVLTAVLQLVNVALFFPLTLLALRWARKIAAFRRAQGALLVEQVLRARRAFWRFGWLCAAGAIVFDLLLATWIVTLPNNSFLSGDQNVQYTIEDLQKIADELEEYAQQHYSYPSSSNLVALAEDLGRDLPMKDAWSNPLTYTPRCDENHCASYLLVSRGIDGQTEPLGSDAGGDTSNVAEEGIDIIFRNGLLVRSPIERNER